MNEMKRYLPPIMRNTFWNTLMDVLEDAIKQIKAEKIDVIKTYYSLSDATEEELIELGTTIYQLDSFMLENLLDFITELELYLTDDYDAARTRALERLRQEIMKIPYSMSERGTLEFYSSILEFCGFNYEGVITLTKTDGDNQIAPIYTNVDLVPHDSGRTELFIPKVSENFSGSENIIFGALDQLLRREDGSTYYETLDSENQLGAETEGEIRRPILDLTSASELDSVNLYRKILMLALVLEQTSSMYFSTGETVGYEKTGDYEYFYAGAPTFPENLGRYYQSFINLNKRATDVLLFGPMLSLNVVRSTIDPENGYDGIVPDSRLIVYSPIATVPTNYVGFRLKYYDTNIKYVSHETEEEKSGEIVPFYEEDIYNVVYTPASEATGTEEAKEETLVLMGMCQGELCGHYLEPTKTIGDEGELLSLSFKVPKSDWSTSITFRLSTNGGHEDCYLLQLNAFGDIIQTASRPGATVILTGSVDTEQDNDYNVVTITNSEAGASVPREIVKVSYLSQYLHSAVKAIQLMSYNADNQETKIFEMEFKENTQLELSAGITLFTFLSIHFDGEFDPASVQSEEAF